MALLGRKNQRQVLLVYEAVIFTHIELRDSWTCRPSYVSGKTCCHHLVGGILTSAGWQVTLCDYMAFRSGHTKLLLTAMF